MVHLSLNIKKKNIYIMLIDLKTSAFFTFFFIQEINQSIHVLLSKIPYCPSPQAQTSNLVLLHIAGDHQTQNEMTCTLKSPYSLHHNG